MRRILQSWVTRFEVWFLSKWANTTYKGICLCDINSKKADDSEFIARTKQALDMIEQKDPRRFRRIQKELRYIANKELNMTGQYQHSIKCCFIDYGQYPFKTHPEWYLCLYAGLLVHEATHGMLYSKGIPYTRETREQIERICHREQFRCSVRIKPEWRENLMEEFDPAGWHFSWYASRWAQLWVLLRRIQNSKRLAKQQIQAVATKRDSA